MGFLCVTACVCCLWSYHYSLLGKALSSLYTLIRWKKTAVRQPLCLLFSGQNKLGFLCLYAFVLCSSLQLSWWLCSGVAIMVLYWGSLTGHCPPNAWCKERRAWIQDTPGILLKKDSRSCFLTKILSQIIQLFCSYCAF